MYIFNVYIYIYIHILIIYIYTYTHTHTHIYIYIYISTAEIMVKKSLVISHLYQKLGAYINMLLYANMK